MAWSIFSDGGGSGAAYTWARDLLRKIGAPLTAGNEQFVFDWEVSEGGGGKFNPLNQGPVPGDPALTTTGSQYGGGAADYASWDAGLQGAADYLGMPSFQGIESALVNNNPQGARSALIASPWASSHYYGGSGFSDEPLPGHASALAPGGDSTGSGGGSGGGGFSLNPFSDLTTALSDVNSTVAKAVILGPVILGAAALGVIGLAKATGLDKRAKEGGQMAAQLAPLAAVAA